MRKLNFQLLVMPNKHESAKSRERKYVENKSDNIGFLSLQMVTKRKKLSDLTVLRTSVSKRDQIRAYHKTKLDHPLDPMMYKRATFNAFLAIGSIYIY